MNTSKNDTSTSRCTHCNEAHKTSRCHTLAEPLLDGFYTGGNGGQGHSHDEEDTAKTYLASNKPETSVYNLVFPIMNMCY